METAKLPDSRGRHDFKNREKLQPKPLPPPQSLRASSEPETCEVVNCEALGIMELVRYQTGNPTRVGRRILILIPPNSLHTFPTLWSPQNQPKRLCYFAGTIHTPQLQLQVRALMTKSSPIPIPFPVPNKSPPTQCSDPAKPTTFRFPSTSSQSNHDFHCAPTLLHNSISPPRQAQQASIATQGDLSPIL